MVAVSVAQAFLLFDGFSKQEHGGVSGEYPREEPKVAVRHLKSVGSTFPGHFITVHIMIKVHSTSALPEDSSILLNSYWEICHNAFVSVQESSWTSMSVLL